MILSSGCGETASTVSGDFYVVPYRFKRISKKMLDQNKTMSDLSFFFYQG
jgi:hypothetical protein